MIPCPVIKIIGKNFIYVIEDKNSQIPFHKPRFLNYNEDFKVVEVSGLNHVNKEWAEFLINISGEEINLIDAETIDSDAAAIFFYWSHQPKEDKKTIVKTLQINNLKKLDDKSAYYLGYYTGFLVIPKQFYATIVGIWDKNAAKLLSIYHNEVEVSK